MGKDGKMAQQTHVSYFIF